MFLPKQVALPMIHVHIGSGTRARTHEVVSFVAERARDDEMLLVGGTREAVDQIAHDVTETHTATFGLGRYSLLQLASVLATPVLVERGLAPATSLGIEAVASRVAFDAAEAGLTPRLEPVRRFPGFASALARTLTELRLARTPPDALRAAGDDSAEIGLLLERYESALRDAGVVDRAGLLALATEAIPETVPSRVAFVDVPIDSRAVRDFVRAILDRAPDAIATVPVGDRPTRLAWMAIARDLPVEIHDQETDEEDAGSTTRLEQLRRNVFADAPPHRIESAMIDESVEFFSAPGEGRECVEIARRLLACAKAGTPFDRMAVFLRSPGTYAPLLETALSRAGIPAYFDRGTARPDPAGRAFLALLSCRDDNLSARRFAEYLSFSQVPALTPGGEPPGDRDVWRGATDESLGRAATAVQLSLLDALDPPLPEPEPDHDDAPALEGALRAPWKWEEYLVEAAVIGGADRWRDRLDGLAAELARKCAILRKEDPSRPMLAALERDATNLAHLRRFALPVIDTLSRLPDHASWGRWLRALSTLAPMVLRRPERVLAVLGELEPMSRVEPVTITEVRAILRERLSTLESDPPPERAGRVFVSTPERARGRHFDVVFVPGLAERVFPERPREDPLLVDVARAKLQSTPDDAGAAGDGGAGRVELRTQTDRALTERLQLLLTIGAANDGIVFSYPRIEVAEARPRVPSFYALDVARAVHGHIPNLDVLERSARNAAEARLVWPAPVRADSAIDPVEHDLAVLQHLLSTDHRNARHVVGRARYLLGLNESLARSLRSRYVRWQRKSWLPQDGIVRRTEATGDMLARFRPSVHPFSTTALQRYARCPYQFLLASIHRLEPRPDAAPLVRMDPLTRGAIYHDIQARAYRALAESDLLPVSRANLETAEATLNATISAVAARHREELFPAIPRVWDDEIDSIRADLRIWLRRMTDESADWTPRHFELAFGLPREVLDGGHYDPESSPSPVTLPGGWKLRGAVDVVDESTHGNALRVTDHKTGRNTTTAGYIVGQGESLQPVLYGLAIENVLRRPVASARLYFATERGGFTEREVTLDERAKRHGIEVFEIVDRAVVSGTMPPAPRKDACAWCDFRLICGPDEERRVRRKDPAFLDDLRELRSLP